MSNVIQFLEVLARRPKGLADAEVAEAAALLAPAVRAAVDAHDAVALGEALQVRATIACYINAPDNDEPAPEDMPADGDEEPASPDTRAA
jgi:hypothetical protein